MVTSPPSPAPTARLRAPRRTARLRLTLMYAGLFLALGTAVIGVIYVVASRGGALSTGATAHAVLTASPGPASGSVTVLPSGVQRRVVRAINTAAAHQHSADANKLLAVSWIVLVVTAVAAALLGWFASGRVLRPLREMTVTARTISAGSLHQRLALAGPEDEFKQLGDTLDDLLARLEAAFEAQRRFVANASHELRTPLTLERTLLQVALADPQASARTLRATCEELLASGRDQEQLLDALLTLASSERGLDRHEPLDLAATARQAVRTPRPEIETGSVQLISSLEPAPTTGDLALIERLMANLIDNAVRYNTSPDGLVEVRTGTAGGRSVLTVTNTGPVVGTDEVERLFEPFQRLGGRRASGADGHHGLGLSIVRAIAAAHGATVSAQPRSGGGLTVTVTFPSTSAP